MTDQKVEFIEVTVDKAQLCQARHHAHALLVNLSWVPQLTHLTASNISLACSFVHLINF